MTRPFDEEPLIVTLTPAEHVGQARHSADGVLRIGEGDGVVEIRLEKPGYGPGWWNTGMVDVYVRRLSSNLAVAEIIMAQHDGLAQEELDAQNLEAERYTLGPKEYWRAEMVGKWTCGEDGHLMTNEDFEADWNDD